MSPGSADAPAERLLKIREALLDRIWRGLFVVALVATPVSISRALFTGWFHMYSVHLVAALAVVFVYLNRARVPFAAKSVLVFVIIWSVGLAGLLTMGLLSAGYWWLVMSSLLVSTLYSLRAGVVSAMVVTVLANRLVKRDANAAPIERANEAEGDGREPDALAGRNEKESVGHARFSAVRESKRGARLRGRSRALRSWARRARASATFRS
jgi:hypothetical protein